MTRTYLFLLTLLLGLAACTDDLARTDTPQPGPGEGLISLSLPGIVYDNADPTATRTQTDDDEADATQEERRVTSLWFMAYPTTNGGGETLVQLLRPSNDELTHDYKTFHIRIKAGRYKIYVVANMPEIGTQTTEDELQKIVLDYRNGTSQNATLVLPSPTGNGLPMVYESEQDITITAAQSQTIQADLVFTCVKVRCTLWFDNSNNGHSHAVFGQNYLQMQNITGRNIATQAPLLPTGKAIEGMELLCTAEGALNGHYSDGEYSKDVHEDLTFTQTTTSNTGKWAYRSTTFYLPEHYVKQNDNQSYLDITAALHDATGVKKANVAYTLPLGDEPTDSQPLRQLPRGKYYDIVGKIVNLGDEIESNVAIMDWTLQEVNTELESQYHLWVEKTSIDELISGTPITIPCRTDAPRLDAHSPTISIVSEGVTILPDTQLFLVTFNEDYTAFTVQINPSIPPSTTWEDQYNYILIRIPDPEAEGKYLLSKRIDITSVDTDPYFHVTPEQYTIRISDIGNLQEHTVIFSYETNLKEVNVTCGNTTITTTGISWSENPNVTITDSGLQDGKGTVSVTLNTPYDPAAYPTLQTVVLDYEATGTYKPNSSTIEETITLTDQTTVTIIPNAQTYRLHFRPVDDSWTNPHIYVYEPLYGMDGREIRIQNANGDDEGEHALQYSFTGKRTFKGWTEQGGTISWSTQQKEDKGNYWLVDYGWDPIRTELYVYYDNIDYSPDFRTDCCASDVNPKWPGVKMKVDTENPGWFYFDLPALAEPDKTLIMFAEGHDGNNDPQERYPAHMVPGVPLYDYADKDGWFLYDWNESDQNEFVDDKPSVPEIEHLNGNTLPDGIYRIYSRRTHFWLWIDGGGNYSTGAWPGEYYVGTMGKDGDNPYYYYYEMVVNSSSRPSWTPGTIQCACTNNGDTGSRIDRTIQVSDWKRVQGSNYYYYVIN